MTASLVLGGAIFRLLLETGARDPLRIVTAPLLDWSRDDVRPDRHSSAHPIWIGLIFAYFVGYQWHITPISNYADFSVRRRGSRGGRCSGRTISCSPG